MLVHCLSLEVDQIRVELIEDLACGGQQLDGRAAAPDDVLHSSVFRLSLQLVDVGSRRLSQGADPGVTGNTNDADGVGVAVFDEPADHVFTGIVAFDERGAHDSDALTVDIGFGEATAPQDGNAHRLEVAGVHTRVVDVDRAVGRLRFDTRQNEALRLDGRTEREAIGESDSIDGRVREKPLHRLMFEIPLLLRCRVTRQRRHWPDQRRRPGIEAGIDPLRLLQAAHEEAGANEQHERERDLHDDQGVAQVEPARPARSPGFILECGRDIRIRRLQCGRKPEGDARQQGDRRREEEDRAVHRDVQVHRHRQGRLERHQQPQRPPGQHDTRGSAQRGQHRGFDEELADERAARGAERQPDRDLLAPLLRPGKEEAGQIGTRDEQHQSHNPEQQRRHRLQQPVHERVQRDVAGGQHRQDSTLVRLRECLCQTCRECLQRLIRLLHRHACSEPRFHEHAPTVRRSSWPADPSPISASVIISGA